MHIELILAKSVLMIPLETIALGVSNSILLHHNALPVKAWSYGDNYLTSLSYTRYFYIYI